MTETRTEPVPVGECLRCSDDPSCDWGGKWGAGVPIEEAPTAHHWHKTEGGGYLAHGEAHYTDGTPLFNEATLRRAIVSVWGEYGAHVTVYDHLLRQSRKLVDIEREIREVLNK
jgi:hypothetical protein